MVNAEGAEMASGRVPWWKLMFCKTSIFKKVRNFTLTLCGTQVSCMIQAAGFKAFIKEEWIISDCGLLSAQKTDLRPLLPDPPKDPLLSLSSSALKASLPSTPQDPPVPLRLAYGILLGPLEGFGILFEWR